MIECVYRSILIDTRQNLFRYGTCNCDCFFTSYKSREIRLITATKLTNGNGFDSLDVTELTIYSTHYYQSWRRKKQKNNNK